MSDSVILVENLSKLYRVGLREEMPDSLVGAIVGFVKRPAKNLQRLRKLSIYRRDHDGSDDTIWALKDVSFEVERGEVVGIIGHNGAGKTTLLKILSRITKPTAGHADIDGRVGSLLEVGTGFHPELTGRENIYLNGAVLGMKRVEIDRKFDEILDFSGVEKFIDTPVKRYSSGMRVRLAFAVAAHLEPEILLVDEVLAVGDVAFQKKCLGKMGDVAKEGRTVLFVSHNMHAVRNLCARAMLLEEGRKVADGDVDDVMAVYLSDTEQQPEATIDLPPGRPGIPMVGRRLRFLGADGIPKTVFRMKEKWRMILEFELFQSLPHVIGAVGIRTVTGIPILTNWSAPKDLTTGRYCVEFSMEAPLRACQLSFVAGLSSNENPIYYANDIGNVTIAQVAEGKQPFRISGKGGILLAEGTSEIMPLPLDSIS
jgi:lipopolysaccharide transport system ATP-binding protein